MQLRTASSTATTTDVFSVLSKASGIVAFFAGSALFCAGAMGLLGFNSFDAPVTLNLNSMSWIADIRIQLDHVEPAPVPIEAVQPITVPQMRLPSLAIAPKKKKQHTLARAQVTTDRIVLHSASPREEAKPVDIAPTAIAAASLTQTTPEQLQKFQSLNAQLRRAFFMTMSPAAHMTIQTAQQERVTTQPQVVAVTHLDPPPQMVRATPQKKLAPRRVVNLEGKFVREVKGLEASTAATTHLAPGVKWNLAAEKSLLQAKKELRQAEFTLASTQIPAKVPISAVTQQAPAKRAPTLVTAQLSQLALQKVKPKNTLAIQKPVAPSVSTSPVRAKELLTQTVVTTQAAPVMATQPTSSTGYANTTLGYSAAQVVSVPAGAAPILVKKPASWVAPKVEPAPAPQVPNVVDAFEWDQPVFNTQSEALTQECTNKEGCAQPNLGWTVTRASSHLPTLTWAMQRGIPLISNNALQMISRLTGIRIQSEAGIVFGKVAPGWNIQFSGRSESVVLLDEKNQLVGPEAITRTRYFAFVNAAPGANLVYISRNAGAQTAAVATPVLNGTATYVDLTSVNEVTANGRVFDASANSQRALAQVNVRVVGQEQLAVFTDRSGTFKIPHVLSIGNHPLFFETESKTGFVHRYRVLSDKISGLSLFRLSPAQIQSWVSQLEGGVSTESAMIVAAAPLLAGSHGDGNLFPSTKSLLGNSTLAPETYTVSPSGQMLVNAALTTDGSRFVSVQVAEGPALVRLEDKTQRTVWSEMIMASPGVINLVGPY